MCVEKIYVDREIITTNDKNLFSKCKRVRGFVDF